MIHTMNEFCKLYPEYAPPMSVCSAMSQGIYRLRFTECDRAELLNKGIINPFLRSLQGYWLIHMTRRFTNQAKSLDVIADGRQRGRKNHVVKTEGGYRRIVAAPKPMDIVEIDAVKALSDADQIVVCGGSESGINAGQQLKGASAVIEKTLQQENWQNCWMQTCLLYGKY